MTQTAVIFTARKTMRLLLSLIFGLSGGFPSGYDR
jgi:hypothetical protein